MDFVHLHVHSHFSLLTGLPKIGDLVSCAKKRGFKALAITDYASLYGAIKFYEECKKQDIKPIIGCEVFVAPNTRFDKRHKIDNKVSHLVLLAKNYEGYKNLMKLSSLSHTEGFYYRPRIDKDLLRKYSSGLIGLSGCLGGEIPQLIMNGVEQNRIDETIKWYADCFGPDHFYIELQDHPEKEGQVEVNNSLIKASERLSIPLVLTRDVHYLNPEDREAQDVLTCIKDGKTVDQPGRFSFLGVNRSLNTAEDIASRFQHVPQAISNTLKIAEMCNLEIPLGSWEFPEFEIPEGKTHADVLKEKVDKGLIDRFGEKTLELEERVNYELDIIIKRGFAPYFLVVSDFLSWAKEQGIVTTTRGSAAGSLVSYSIGITSVDPMKYKLPFERFLNPFRPSPPDVDADFADYRRDEVIEYVTKKYGKDKVAQICTFGTMAARASIRDVGRALGYSYNMVDSIAKLVPMGSQGFPMTIDRALEIAPDFKNAYEKNPEVSRMVDLAKKIEGCARHVSVHAAGVVISPTPLNDFTPIQREPGGDKLITQYEMKTVEKAGLLKMDFLGLRNLSILEEAVRYVRSTRGVEVDLENIPLDDKKTYEMLGRGETAGVFQLSSSGMTRYLKDLKPGRVNDLMAMVALYRPGPMESIPEYISRKHDSSRIKYLDERLKDILDMSYGVITYQDDVLLTAIHLAGYTWGEADKLRKAMGKKIPAEMAKQKEKLLKGFVDNGLSEEKAEMLWKQIEPFAAYGFNKSHSASYGMVSYLTAYMKANYPAEYMAALLSCESHDLEKVAVNVQECEKMGIPVLPPDVNESFRLFGVVDAKINPRIRFGLGAIKNVGTHIAQVIIDERKNRGKYKDLGDLLIRVRDKDLNKKSLESLIKSGAMDCFGERGKLLFNIEKILIFSREAGQMVTSKQTSLFGGTFGGMKVRLDESQPVSNSEKLVWEKELLGLYVSAHPAGDLEKAYDENVFRINDIKTQKKKRKWVCIAGVVQGFKRVITKKGDAMGFMTLEDTSGSIEIVVFPRAYNKYRELCEEGGMVAVVGKCDSKSDEIKVLAERMALIKPETAKSIISKLLEPEIPETVSSESNPTLSNETSDNSFKSPAMIITLSADREEGLSKVKEVVTERPGRYAVYVKIPDKIGHKMIESGFSTCVDPRITAQIEELVGEGKVEIVE